MKLVLDFDRTLFDVESLYKALEEADVTHQVGTIESLEKIDVQSFVFPDVYDLLAEYDIMDIFILSSFSGTTADWTEVYQHEKIVRSGLARMVGEVTVMYGEKGVYVSEIAHRYKNQRVFFVDDQLMQCQSVKALAPTTVCFLMDRSKEKVSIGDITVLHSLSELRGYIS